VGNNNHEDPLLCIPVNIYNNECKTESIKYRKYESHIGQLIYLEDITRTFNIAAEYYYLCKLPFGEDMVVPLPNSLNGHGGSKKTICYTKNCKDDNENNHKGKACLHGSGKAIQDAPSITTVLTTSHSGVIGIEGGAMQYETKKPNQYKEGQHS